MTTRRRKSLGFTDERHDQEARHMTTAGVRALDRAKERLAAGNCKGTLDDLANAYFYAGSAIQHQYAGSGNQRGAYALEEGVNALKEKFFATCAKRRK